MPERKTIERAQEDAREGKSPSTQAGEFVREEMHHVREGKHGAASSKQAIAIGLSKARRAGVKLSPPREGKASASTTRKPSRIIGRGKAIPLTSLRPRDPERIRMRSRGKVDPQHPIQRYPSRREPPRASGQQPREAARRKKQVTRGTGPKLRDHSIAT